MLRRIGEAESGQDSDRRLWFNSPAMDLVVVLDDRGELRRFQISWDKGRDEKSLTWDRDSGFSHGRVLDGEDRPGRHKATPLVVGGEPPTRHLLLADFAREAGDLPGDLREKVQARLEALPSTGADEKL